MSLQLIVFSPHEHRHIAQPGKRVGFHGELSIPPTADSHDNISIAGLVMMAVTCRMDTLQTQRPMVQRSQLFKSVIAEQRSSLEDRRFFIGLTFTCPLCFPELSEVLDKYCVNMLGHVPRD